MGMKQQLLIDTLEQRFEMGKYIKFIAEFFNTVKINSNIHTNEKVWGEYTEHIKSYTKIGRYIDENKKKIDIWAVQLKSESSVERARSLQRNFVSKLLTADNSHAGIVAFYVEDAASWRLSFVKLDYEFSPKGIQIETTPAKRYSYLVGEGEKSHTAQEQLLPIFQNEKENPTLEVIEEAFSVETVTKEFFAKYKEKYLQLKEFLDGKESFIQTAEQYNFTTEQFAKKLMGQLAFLYFLQKKGWLGVSVAPKNLTEKQYKDIFFRQKGDARQVFSQHYKQLPDGRYVRTSLVDLEQDKHKADLFAGCFVGIPDIYKPWGSGDKNFIRRIYDNCIDRGLNFFDEYLEPLFYNALNNPRGKNCYFPAFNSKIPFLNGGLFEPLFDKWEEKHFDIPNEIFSNAHLKKKTESDGILDIFEHFNFTINEDEPLEREVAVDPEMLGKIFENLLDVKDRKSKGAFYTPREIVHYMCQESLINHLVNEVGVPYDDMKQFVLYGEMITNQDNSRKTKDGEQEKAIPKEVYNRIEAIDRALSDIRVADPAVGSGAFPLGILNEIVKLRNNITQYMINAVPDQYPGQKDLLRINRHPYKLKWETIQNCIFAVDIEASAVDITKLRLWLSLIVDQEIDELNEYPHALPNLDCNIMCGNSLIEEFKGIKLFDEKVLEQIGSKVNEEKESNINSQLSLDTAKQEAELNDMFNDLFDLQKELFGEDDPERKRDIKRRIDNHINTIIEFQLRYVNLDEEGFKQYKDSIKLRENPYFLWKLEFARVFKEKKGFDIVIGNPPYGAKFNSKIKKYLSNRYPLVPDYESADYFIYKGIELLKYKGDLSYIIPNTILANLYAENIRKDLLLNYNIYRIDNLSDVDVFESAKVRTCIISIFKQQLNEYKTQFINGNIGESRYLLQSNVLIDNTFLSKNNSNWLNTFYQEPKTIALVNKLKDKKVLLGNLCEISQGLIPYDKYRGHSKETIQNRVWHATYRKDDTYRRELQGKDIHRYNLEWGQKSWISYGEWLAAPRKPEFFKNKRILIREITNPRILATITEEEYYNTPSIINLINFVDVDIRYVLGILNSKLISYYHMITSPKANKGLFPKILVNDVRNIPIKLIDDHRKEELIQLVKEIEEKVRENDSQIMDEKIDQLVYTIYELTDEEINQIEETFKK